MSASDLFGAGADPLDLIERAADSAVDETKWAPLLTDILRVLEALNKRKGIVSSDAFADARDSTIALAEYFGGRMLYMPKGDRLRRALRDAEIWRRFDGTNVAKLAADYEVSEIHMYAILKEQRALNLRKLQGRLFDQ